MKLSHALFAASICVALTSALGCSDGSSSTTAGTGGTATEGGKAVSSLAIEPKAVTLSKGATKQYKATASYADGSTKDVTDNTDTVWNTSDPAKATVSKTGLVTAIDAAASVTISAEFKGQKAEDTLIISP